jgi:hypothetical protein
VRIATKIHSISGLSYVQDFNLSNYLEKGYSLNRYVALDTVASTGVALGIDDNACFMIDTHPQRASVDYHLRNSFWMDDDSDYEVM